MSTDRKRLNSAIQRIARQDPEIRKLLEDFRNSGGKPSESATSGSGAEDRQICCDGSSPNNPNPGSDTRDPSDNPKDGIDPDDPADISDNLSGVTDCTTGTPICFSGNDWIPPDGWDSPTDPPPDPTWQDGSYWKYSSEIDDPDVPGVITETQYYAGKPSICGGIPSCANIDCDETVTFASGRCQDEQGNPILYFTIGREQFDCTNATTQEEQDACVDQAPLLDAWPEDGCVNLATKGGKLVGSKYDPENDGSWSAPRDEVELCDAFGNSFKLKGSGSIEGGWKSISAQNPDDGYLYNAKGEQIARISESEYSDPTM